MAAHARALTAADRRAIATDQVVRLRSFRAAFPGVRITSPREAGGDIWLRQWTAEWDDGAGEPATLAHHDLRYFIDHLAAIFGWEEEPQA